MKAFKTALVVVLVIVAGCASLVASLILTRNTPLDLPTPTGAYSVGRRQYDWVDRARTDPLADQPGIPRKLTVWVWYPAATHHAAIRAPYLPPTWVQARNADQGVGILMEHNFATIRTNSLTDAPLADSQRPFPVLIMEPGMGPLPSDYTVLAEDLASHGYVVVGINPTYTSFVIVFADGHVVRRSASGAIPDLATPAMVDQIGNRIMNVWASDVRFAMDQIDRTNADQASPFYGRLDVTRIGVFGHSFGGATAFYVCQHDPRCKAGANLDGTMFSVELHATVQHPFLVMTEDYTGSCDRNCMSMRQMYEHTQAGAAYLLMVRGARHFDFSDLPGRQVPLARPFFQLLGVTGSMSPERGEQIASVYLVAFFDRYLRDFESPLLSGPSQSYPEVQFSRR